MSDQNVTTVPQHLQELIPTTPSGVLKLLAAWEGDGRWRIGFWRSAMLSSN